GVNLGSLIVDDELLFLDGHGELDNLRSALGLLGMGVDEGGFTRSTLTRGSLAMSAAVAAALVLMSPPSARATAGMTIGASAPAKAAPARIVRRVT
ncbi:MAG: hypothetical protein K0M47_23615, partial [Rhizobium sp.]|nr:hypothetical protein [Rhizobium sp.]